MTTLRPAVAADAEAICALRRVVAPYLVHPADSVRHAMTIRAPEEHFGMYVAEAETGLSGVLAVGLQRWSSERGAGYLGLSVHPDHRRQGIGTALADLGERHLAEAGARRARVWVQAESLPFALARGYTETRRVHFAGLELRSPPVLELPPGLRFARLAELDPRQVYAADVIAQRDKPADAPTDAIAYDQWLRAFWHGPSPDLSMSVAAVAADEVVCFTAVEVDGDRIWSPMTGTVPAYRGQGLAKIVKAEALRAAAAAGVTWAYTANDAANRAMLAVNRWLGYRHIATQSAATRSFTA
ncbi:GNAT family N-acetyltransferase [Kribbella deserti]|uniref:GNAT family N-acetyltransferase n=1 Tax=Kribbella deserti TaxID=1926257 RepID=A0ABV6QD18_9ACTN